MEIVTGHTRQFNDIANMLHFIAKYRQMEKAPLTTGYQMIGEFAAAHQVDHLRSSWKSKHQEFGRFYLNIDLKYRVAITQRFGIHDQEDIDFITAVEANPRAMVFEQATGFMATAKKVLVFFENHGIDPDPIGDGSLMLTNLPAAKKRFGNSANWGDYVMSLLMQDRIRVLTAILNRPD